MVRYLEIDKAQGLSLGLLKSVLLAYNPLERKELWKQNMRASYEVSKATDTNYKYKSPEYQQRFKVTLF